MSFYNLYQQAPKHKTFISFHHADEEERKEFEDTFGNVLESYVSKSVKYGDIDPYKNTDDIRRIIRDNFIADATVTVVLIGEETWKRKHVDWEIASSIRETRNNSRTGLIGILLPSYSKTINALDLDGLEDAENFDFYNPNTIPPRLYDNVQCGFAKIYSYPSNPDELRQWIHEAFERRKNVLPDNSYPSFANNRPESQTQWQPS